MSVVLQLRNGNIHYISDAGVSGKVERTVGDAVLSDGQWHTLQLVKNSSATVIHLDSGQPRIIQHPTQDFGGLGVLTFSLGGIPSGPAQQKTAAGEDRQCLVFMCVGQAHVAKITLGHVPTYQNYFFFPPSCLASCYLHPNGSIVNDLTGCSSYSRPIGGAKIEQK